VTQFSDFLSLNREMKKKLKLLHHFISFLEEALDNLSFTQPVILSAVDA
jgi:hypothetical protein